MSLIKAAEMILEVFDNNYGQIAKDIAISDLRHALNDKNKVAELIEKIPHGLTPEDFLIALAKLAAAAEREVCAQVCEDHFSADGNWCAQIIRQRGNT